MGKVDENAPSHHRISIQEVIGASGNEDPSAKGHSSLDAPSMPVCNHEAAPATHYGSLAHAGVYHQHTEAPKNATRTYFDSIAQPQQWKFHISHLVIAADRAAARLLRASQPATILISGAGEGCR